MAEFIFKDMIRRRGIEGEFFVISRATSDCEVGADIYPPAKRELESHGIYANHKSTMLIRADIAGCDYALVMDSSNLADVLRVAGGEFGHKVFKLCSFTSRPRDVADPWYTRDFAKAYADIEDGCKAFLKYLGY